MIHDLIPKLLNNVGNCALTHRQYYGTMDSRFSSVQYCTKDITATLNCVKKFRYNKDEFRLDSYQYEVLYSCQKDWKQNAWCGDYTVWNASHCKYHFIVKISDKNSDVFYMYVYKNYYTACESCDGELTNYEYKIIYSDSLQDLIMFVFTDADQKIIYESIGEKCNVTYSYIELSSDNE